MTTTMKTRIKKSICWNHFSLCNFILTIILINSSLPLLTGCASSLKDNSQAIDPVKAYKISIVNASQETINAIKYKPCNSHSVPYQYLTANLHPSEKFTINIYSQCVDLLATNAFKKKLVDVKNVDLKSVKTWTIK